MKSVDEFQARMLERLQMNKHKDRAPLTDDELMRRLLHNLAVGDYIDVANYAFLLYKHSE